MTNRRLAWSIARQWLGGLTAVSLIIAPMAGCPTSVTLPGGGGGGTGNNNPGSKPNLTEKSSGFFINDDSSSKLLVAGRDNDGNGFFVYGSRNTQGKIGEIE